MNSMFYDKPGIQHTLWGHWAPSWWSEQGIWRIAGVSLQTPARL